MIFVSNVVRFPMLSSMIIVQCCPMLSNIIIVQCSGAFLEAAVGGWKEAGGEGAGSKVQNHQSNIKIINIIAMIIIIKIIIIIMIIIIIIFFEDLCLHGGICWDGHCRCRPGFTGRIKTFKQVRSKHYITTWNILSFLVSYQSCHNVEL